MPPPSPESGDAPFVPAADVHTIPTRSEISQHEARLPNDNPDAAKMDLAQWKRVQKKDIASKYKDPCKFAADQSMLCLDQNLYDKSKCTEYFQAYKDCKEVWMSNQRAVKRGKAPPGVPLSS